MEKATRDSEAEVCVAFLGLKTPSVVTQPLKLIIANAANNMIFFICTLKPIFGSLLHTSSGRLPSPFFYHFLFLVAVNVAKN